MGVTYWTAGASGSADDDGNWDNGVPNASNHAHFRSASSNHKCKWNITTAVEGITQDSTYTGEIYLVNNLYMSSSALADKILCRNASSVFTSNNYKIVNSGGSYLYFLGGTANMGDSDVSSSRAISLGATVNIGAGTWTCGDDFRGGTSVINITGDALITGTGGGQIGGTGWTVAGTNAPVIKYGRIYGSQGFAFAEVGHSRLVINAKGADDTTLGKTDGSDFYLYDFVLDNPSTHKQTCYQYGKLICSGQFIVSGGTYQTRSDNSGGWVAYNLDVSGGVHVGPEDNADHSTDATFQTSSSTCNFRPYRQVGSGDDAGIYHHKYGTTDLGTGVINCNGFRIVGPNYATTTPFTKDSGEINIYGYWDSNEYYNCANSAGLNLGSTNITVSSSTNNVLWNLQSAGGSVHSWICNNFKIEMDSASNYVSCYNRQGNPAGGIATRNFEVSGTMDIHTGKWYTRTAGTSNHRIGLYVTSGLTVWPDGEFNGNVNDNNDSGIINAALDEFGSLTLSGGATFIASSGTTRLVSGLGSVNEEGYNWTPMYLRGTSDFIHSSGTFDNRNTKGYIGYKQGAGFIPFYNWICAFNSSTHVQNTKIRCDNNFITSGVCTEGSYGTWGLRNESSYATYISGNMILMSGSGYGWPVLNSPGVIRVGGNIIVEKDARLTLSNADKDSDVYLRGSLFLNEEGHIKEGDTSS